MFANDLRGQKQDSHTLSFSKAHPCFNRVSCAHHTGVGDTKTCPTTHHSAHGEHAWAPGPCRKDLYVKLCY